MSTVMFPVTAVCRGCRDERDLNEFCRDASKRSGYKSICKDCDRERYSAARLERARWHNDASAPLTRERAWLVAERGKRARMKWGDAEVRRARRVRGEHERHLRRSASGQDRDRQRESADRNRDMFSAARWETARRNADRPLMRAARYRAQRRAMSAEERRLEFNAKVLATYHADPQNWSTQKRRVRIFDRDGWRCRICRRKVRDDVPRNHLRRANVGHIVAKSTGGEWSDENLATLCFDCNRKDGVNKIPIQKHLVLDV